MIQGLRARIPEICQAIHDRLHGLEGESPTRDVEYHRGLREAVHRGVEYGIALIADDEAMDPHFPLALVVQARLAARQRIPLAMVLRRYVAARDLLSGFVLEEAVAIGGQNHILLRDALATQGAAFDRLLASVTREYKREEPGSIAAAEAQLLKRVQRLLAGEQVDSSPLHYPFERYHLGLIAGSLEGRQVIRRLAAATDTRPLIVSAPGEEVWGWLGSEDPLELRSIRRIAASVCVDSMRIGFGEPAPDRSGWRLTHKQARQAFGLTQAGQEQSVHYADVPMVAGAARDPLLRSSLRELYLVPLDREPDGGKRLRRTLRAYFAADRNGRSAGAAIGVTGQTVKNHLCQVEDRLGQPLSVCADAVNVALRLEELGLLE